MQKHEWIVSGHAKAGDPTPGHEPRIRVLNFSGGQGSTALLRMVLRGDIEVDLSTMVVLSADPGMENGATYDHIKMMHEECTSRGVYAQTCPGPNLYRDLVELPSTSKTRFDQPAYFAKKPDGKRGKLAQRCTEAYKIKPMDRALRLILRDRFGISLTTKRLGVHIVEKWIGFSAEEFHRIKPPRTQQYIYFRYPLIEQGITKPDAVRYLERNNLPVPPRSVCNACFANSPEFLREMYENRPADWAQAVAVDDAVRDWRQIGIDNPIYVSDTLIPLRDLPGCGFNPKDYTPDPDAACEGGGHCFT